MVELCGAAVHWPLKEQGIYDSRNNLVFLVERASADEPQLGCVISVMIKGEMRRITLNHVGAIVATDRDSTGE